MCVGKNTTSSPGFTLLHSAISLDLSEWRFSNFLPSAVLSHRTFVLLSTGVGRHILERRISRLGVLATTCMLLENQFRVDSELALVKKTKFLRSVPEMSHVLPRANLRTCLLHTVGFLETLTLICKDRFPHLTSFLGYRRDLVVPLADSS